MKILKSVATVLTFATASLLAGCGHPPLALNGLQLGMSVDTARAAAPANTQLYCEGGGNDLIDSTIAETTSGWDTKLKYCVWASVASHDVAPVRIANSLTDSYVLAFAPKPGADQQAAIQAMSALAASGTGGQDPTASIPDADWHLETFRANFAVNTYQPLVADLTGKLGKPQHEESSKDSLMPYVGSIWWNDSNSAYVEVIQSPANKATGNTGDVMVILVKSASDGTPLTF